jgi:hypothetical protein
MARERTNKQLNSHEVPKPRVDPQPIGTTAARGERITATPPMMRNNLHVYQYVICWTDFLDAVLWLCGCVTESALMDLQSTYRCSTYTYREMLIFICQSSQQSLSNCHPVVTCYHIRLRYLSQSTQGFTSNLKYATSKESTQRTNVQMFGNFYFKLKKRLYI